MRSLNFGRIKTIVRNIIRESVEGHFLTADIEILAYQAETQIAWLTDGFRKVQKVPVVGNTSTYDVATDYMKPLAIFDQNGVALRKVPYQAIGHMDQSTKVSTWTIGASQKTTAPHNAWLIKPTPTGKAGTTGTFEAHYVACPATYASDTAFPSIDPNLHFAIPLFVAGWTLLKTNDPTKGEKILARYYELVAAAQKDAEIIIDQFKEFRQLDIKT